MSTLNPKITNAGLALYPAPALPGFKVQLTHIALGTGKYKPVGTEVALQDEVARYPILPNSATSPSPTQVQISANITNQDPLLRTPNGKWIGEIGFYAGNTLFAVWSQETNALFYKTADFDVPIAYTLDVSVLPAESVTVNVSADAAGMGAMIFAHEANADPHPQYFKSRDEVLPGGLSQQVLRKKSNAAGDWEWIDLTAGIVVNVNTQEESQLLAANQVDVVLTKVTTNGMVIHVGGARLDAGIDFTKHPTDVTRLTLTRSYPANTRITISQNEVAGQIINPLDRTKNLQDVENPDVARKNIGAAHVTSDVLNKNVAGGVDVVLTADEALNDILVLGGELTANINLIVPDAANEWLIWNNTTGTSSAWGVTIKTAAGIGVPIVRSKSVRLWCDGINVLPAQTDFSAGVATQAEVNAGSDDMKIVTPKKLRAGFAANLVANGYVAFPSWLGGWILNWGGGVTSPTAGQAGSTSWPMAYPNSPLCLCISNSGSSTSGVTIYGGGTTNSGFTHASSAASLAYSYISIGR